MCVFGELRLGQRGIRSPGAGVRGGYELPDMGPMNQTLVLWSKQVFLTAGTSLQPNLFGFFEIGSHVTKAYLRLIM